MSRRWPLLLPVILLASLACTARAGDWTQFRGGSARLGTGGDPITLPLTPIWTWKSAPSRAANGRVIATAPLTSAALWHRRAYFYSNEDFIGVTKTKITRPHVVCINADTGTLVWKRALGSVRTGTLTGTHADWVSPRLVQPVTSAPALTASGLVIVEEPAMAQPLIALYDEKPPVYDPDSKNPIDWYVNSLLGLYASDGRLSMVWDPSPHLADRRFGYGSYVLSGGVEPVPPIPTTGPFLQGSFSHPAIRPDGVTVTSLWAGVSRWEAQQSWKGHPLATARFATGAVGFTAIMQCFPPTVGSEGVVIAARSKNQRTRSGPEADVQYTEPDWKFSQQLPEFTEEAREINKTFLISPKATSPYDPRMVRRKIKLQPNNDGFLAMLGHDLRPIWSRLDLPDPSAVALHNGSVIARMGMSVMSLNVSNGRERWCFPRSPVPRRGDPGTSHDSDPGVVVTDNRVFTQVRQELVALDFGTGELLWHFKLATPSGITPAGLIGAGKYLFASESDRVFALDQETGKLLWQQAVPCGGSLSTANGILYLANGTSLTAFAPAERTYVLAANSERREDYNPRLGAPVKPKTEVMPDPDPLAPAPEAEKKPEDPPKPPAVADATVLRLNASEPEEQLLKRARERRMTAPDVPLLLSLDWCDATRTQAKINGDTLARLAHSLAAAVRPEHFDLAPEVNVYLERHPSEIEAVTANVIAAARAVKSVSPSTQVLVSLNVEVLLRLYGKPVWLPFGDVTPAVPYITPKLGPLVTAIDELGLTTVPQSAFIADSAVPNDHLLSVQALFPNKPLLLTRIRVTLNLKTDPERDDARRLARHVLQLAYWLDARLVTYPELEGPSRNAGAAPAAGLWADVPHWTRVKILSAVVGHQEAVHRNEDDIPAN